MTRDEVKDMIVSRITEKQGMRASDVSFELDIVVEGLHLGIQGLCEELVQAGRLAVVDFCLTGHDRQLKSLYFPSGTIVMVYNK